MEILRAFNWFDIALGLVIFVSAVSGLRTGFARVVIGLVATVVGLHARLLELSIGGREADAVGA